MSRKSDKALRVACSVCHAQIGEKCMDTRTGIRRHLAHHPRVLLAKTVELK